MWREKTSISNKIISNIRRKFNKKISVKVFILLQKRIYFICFCGNLIVEKDRKVGAYMDAFMEWYYYTFLNLFQTVFGTTPDTGVGTGIMCLMTLAYPICYYMTGGSRH